MSAVLEAVSAALEAAEAEFIRAEHDAGVARELLGAATTNVEKLRAAVAALNGEVAAVLTTEDVRVTLEQDIATDEGMPPPDLVVFGKPGEKVNLEGIKNRNTPSDTKPIHDPNNPFAAMKCSGCGRYGGLMMVKPGVYRCGKCGNEIIG